MRYVALFTGSGEGCDYTIGCNRRFEVFEAASDEAAIKRCHDIWEDHGSGHGDILIESIQLFGGCEPVLVDVETWNEEAIRSRADEEAADELESLQARVRELKARKR